ncbi:hypothetical protein AGMMS49944_08350 [Spirochaetia bacterium]|nr:hypothetical protein AGMMS49944_08350 [Spirochaetia bacterium]
MITDDGRGFDTADYEGSGNTGGNTGGRLGIRGMYERAALLGGILSFKSGSGEGVMVRLELPQGVA